MKPLFSDPSLQDQFDRLGYVKVQLLDKDDVQALLDHYNEQNFQTADNENFFVSLNNADSDTVRSVRKEIEEIIFPKTQEVLKDCQIFTASYVVKEPGEKNIVPPHQDWTFVDESNYCSASVWTPLVDVTEENGALGVIPGSHNIFNYPRASPSPQYKAGLTDHVFTLFPYVEIIDMKAGESLIFNNKLIHASPPNHSDQTRIAVGIGITQKEAQLLHYYLTPNSGDRTLEVYEVDADFFNVYNNVNMRNLYLEGKTLDDLKKIDTIKNYKKYNFDKADLVAEIQALPNAKINQGLMEKLAKIFDYNIKNMEPQKSETENQSAESTNKWENRTFFQKYSPGNIIRELIWRLGGRKEKNQ